MRWPDDIKVAVNLSPVQFKQAELFDVIRSALKNSGLPPAAAGDRDHRIRAAGAGARKPRLHRAAQEPRHIAGARRFRHRLFVARLACTAFPFNKIKIDKSFIADLTRNYKSTAIVCTIVTLACGLDMSVTVEGVETREQFERLKSLGVNFAQGYLMGRPVPIDELERQPQVYRPRQDAA